ncbi:MAG: hypothetical protein KJP26_08165 [Maribacter sp.]|nr:hypothetical protein [Maribacter sp.]
MEDKSKQGNPDSYDPIWDNETNPSAHSSEWIGAVLRYLFSFGSIKFESIYINKDRNKNSIIGTVAKLSLFFLVLYLAFSAV